MSMATPYPKKAMAANRSRIVTKLIYGAVPVNVKSAVAWSSAKSYPFMATLIGAFSL